MVKEPVEELLLILGEQTQIYDRLLKMSKEKTAVIVRGKVSELDTIVKAEQEMIFKMGALEEKREAAVEKIAGFLNKKPADLNISEILPWLDSALAKKLEGERDKLNTVLNEVSELNSLNLKLVKNSLDYIDFSINLMLDDSNAGNNYGNNGKVSDWDKRNLFDMKL